MSTYDLPVRFRPPPEPKEPGPQPDPVQEAAEYVNHHWFQQLIAVKTQCYRCRAESPVVHVHYGALAFGNPRILKGRGSYRERDITKETQEAFANVGWKFQLRRSYCPKCKGLGTV